MNQPHASRSASIKLLELNSLIETARSSLLDAVVMANELYEVLVASEAGVTDSPSVLNAEQNHEDNQPGSARDWCP